MYSLKTVHQYILGVLHLYNLKIVHLYILIAIQLYNMCDVLRPNAIHLRLKFQASLFPANPL